MNTPTHATEAETLARAFAAKWDSAAVREAIAHAEAGRISWVDIAALFARSYGQAISMETGAAYLCECGATFTGANLGHLCPAAAVRWDAERAAAKSAGAEESDA